LNDVGGTARGESIQMPMIKHTDILNHIAQTIESVSMFVCRFVFDQDVKRSSNFRTLVLKFEFDLHTITV